MNRVKYTTTSTGTGDLTLAVATGFQAYASGGRMLDALDTNDPVFYFIVAGNDTDWEYGVSTINGNLLERGTGSYNTVIQSSNSNSAVNLPAGTHTVFLSRGAMEGDVRTIGLIKTSSSLETTTTISASNSAAVSWTALFRDFDPFSWATRPNYTAPSEGSPESQPVPTNMCPFARAYQLQLWVEPSTSGAFRAEMNFYDSSADETYYFWGGGNNHNITITTPWFGDGGPFRFNDSAFNNTIYNDSGGSISFKARLFITFQI